MVVGGGRMDLMAILLIIDIIIFTPVLYLNTKYPELCKKNRAKHREKKRQARIAAVRYEKKHGTCYF